MPPLPGETLLLTLFADVHYYFNDPVSRPLHHRLDKGSYVYLYHNTTQRRARLEIANAAGTSEQDAFDGYLDSVLIKNKFQQPTLLSVIAHAMPTNTPRQADQSQWRLPAYDLRNEQKYLYSLHSLDVYFWTANDASKFVDHVRRLLPRNQLDIAEPPSTVEHRDSMSPVVEKLEQAAIHSPPQVHTPGAVASQSYAETSPQNRPTPSPQPLTAQSTFAPYNPAAPAAPEPIAHRDKTPPPPDGASGTGLAEAAIHDQSHELANAPTLAHTLSYQHAAQQQAFPGPPQRSTSIMSIPPPPPSTMPPTTAPYQPAGYGSSMSSLPALPLSPPPNQTSFSGPPQHVQAQQATYPQYHMSGYTLQSPGLPPYGSNTPLQSPGLPQHAPFPSPGLPPPPSGPPVGGYSNYSYDQQVQRPQSHEAYQVHNQVYKPTALEASHAHGKPAQPHKPGAFEGGLGKLEKGVGRFLRKLDK